ncbi:sigma-70 family RNA polymerase sigma factor [Sanguibacter suaedae]|uniref:Sigma-70 family RNA polymerase sigma factor n=1 Tax=Sanguibacter suaedae TaxID=2795737 RepID=A0A934IAB8_9MICO|nr:sigma-70 family RNA polymerase sigma factor [Sanguibacter suaedae]MBI9115997.1 sigma-70 family RNA polymerase sigma factor [Sanguibacter suaedae]
MADWESALDHLARTRHRALIRYAYLLCGAVREAEDLVQDALVKIYARKHLPAADDAEAYVRRAILTIYLDGYRRRRRWSGIKHLVGIKDHQESPELATSTQVDVAVALDGLSPRQRACVVLRYFEDLTVPQIATTLDCAEGTVKRHLSDAHARLATVLGPLHTPDEPGPAAPAATPSPMKTFQPPARSDNATPRSQS